MTQNETSVDRSATEFTPSEHQLDILSVFTSEDYQVSVLEACSAVGIERSTYYRWFDHPEFCEWWQAQAVRHFTRDLPEVYGNLREMAAGRLKDGQAKAAQLLLERFDKGFMPKSRSEIAAEVKVSGPVQLQWTDDQRGSDGE